MATKAKQPRAAAATPDTVPRLSAHPRAQTQIAQAKGAAGLAVFALVLLLSAGSGVPWFDAVARAIAIGTAGYLVAWAAAIVVWRQLARAELEIARRTVAERRQAAVEAALQAREAAAAARGAQR
jgi:uncharacterized membrane protein YccC